MKYKKEELEKLIFEEKLSYEEIGRRYEVTGAYIKKVSRKLGIELPIRQKNPSGWKPHNAGKAKQKKIIPKQDMCHEEIEHRECLFCKNIFTGFHTTQKFCKHKCSSDYRKEKKYLHFIGNQEEYCRDRNMRFVKPWILKEQNECCGICGIKNEWNGKELNFVLDHIDGRASNNMRDNLRLICHNCDSQLETYKSKNKNSCRKERYQKSYKNT